MKRIVVWFLTFCLLLPWLFATADAASAAGNDYSAYVEAVEIKRNDTLFEICRSRGLRLSEVKAAIIIVNHMAGEKSLDVIQAGQKIYIPKSREAANEIVRLSGSSQPIFLPSETSSGTSEPIFIGQGNSASFSAGYLVSHIMQRGETLSSVSSLLGVPYSSAKEMLLRLNGITDERKVYEGRSYYFLSTSDAQALYKVYSYTILKGDTVNQICRKQGLVYNQVSGIIQALNPGMNLNAIKAGAVMQMISPVNAVFLPSAPTPTAKPTGTTENISSYQSVINSYYSALKNKLTREQCIQLGVSYLVPDYSETTLGYCLQDVNGDRVNELLIGSGKQILAMYTLSGTAPVLVFEGTERSRYYLEPDGILVNVASNSAFQSGYQLFRLNGSKLVLKGAIISDYQADAKNPWYYAEDSDWNVANDQKVTTAKAESWIQAYESNYLALPYRSFSAVNQ